MYFNLFDVDTYHNILNTEARLDDFPDLSSFGHHVSILVRRKGAINPVPCVARDQKLGYHSK